MGGIRLPQADRGSMAAGTEVCREKAPGQADERGHGSTLNVTVELKRKWGALRKETRLACLGTSTTTTGRAVKAPGMDDFHG